jgi:hypothetical protein
LVPSFILIRVFSSKHLRVGIFKLGLTCKTSRKNTKIIIKTKKYKISNIRSSLNFKQINKGSKYRVRRKEKIENLINKKSKK